MAVMITTEDNPFDPREDYWSWYQWDVEHGYNTCSYLARIVHLSDGFPQAVQDKETEKAIDEIIEMHDGGLYKKLELAA